MIEFKEINKQFKIVDIDNDSIAIINAITLYNKYSTDRKILHLFYNSNWDFFKFEEVIDLTEYDKVFLDFSGADDYWLRYEDMDTVKSKLNAKEIIVISKNAFEKKGYIYNDPLMHRIKVLDFELKNTKKDNIFFFLGGHARYYRLLFLNKLLQKSKLNDIIWSSRRIEYEDKDMFRSCIPLEYMDVYKDLEILNHLPKSLDFDIHNQYAYHNVGNAAIFDNPGYVANLDFYNSTYVELVGETVFEFAINPAKKDKEFIIMSEKVFKPLVFGFPFIGLVLPKTFSKIKEWGFELFDELIDYSFDNEYNDEKRMDMIVQQICENDIKEKFEKNFEVINEKHLHNKKMFLELKERLLKNYEKSLLC
jgi:hypothetical protein